MYQWLMLSSFPIVESKFLFLAHGGAPYLQLDQTPLSHAAEKDNDEIVKLLLENGARRDLKDADGKTPLSRALSWGNTDVIQPLRRELR